jgi:P27 family predicted phage terminase small subunit
VSKPGPPPTPTEKLKRRGSWRAKTRSQEPRPKAARPRAPAWLSKDARTVFQAVVRQLYAEGMVARTDENALARYADLFVQYRQASEFLAKYGAMYAVPGRPGPDGKPGPSTGFRTYPHAQRALALSRDLLRLEEQCGMTPASRSRLVAETPAPAAPHLERYFQPVRILG